MSQASTTPRALLRLTVQSEGRRLDIGVPAQVPLVEVMPGFARSLGVLDPTMTYAGYALQRADGTVLDAAKGAADQGVADGEVLTLARGPLLAAPRVYDDIVEAVIDATGEQKPWTAKDNTRTALAVSLTLLGICAVLLIAGGRGGLLSIIIAASGTLVLLIAAAFISRVGQPEAGSGLGLAAAAFGAVAGYLLAPEGVDLWGWPLAAAGLGAMIVGGAAVALSPYRPELQLVPVITGAAIAIPASLTGLMPDKAVACYALMVAIAGTVSNSLPWLALSSTHLRVISAQTDAEVFADPTPINPDEVKRRAVGGQRVLTVLRFALSLSLIAATPLVAGASPLGALLCALAFVGTMFPARMSFSRTHVLVLISMAAAGIAITCLTVVFRQSELAPLMLIVLAVVAVVTITLTLLSPKARLRLGRLADTFEVLVIAVLLPIGMIASGLV